jgi:hypothetical protein
LDFRRLGVEIEELVGIPTSRLNDDRLGQALDAIYPHLEEIWAEVVSFLC